MIEILRKKIRKAPADQKINVLREYLQILILKILSDKKVFNNIVFVGGTALRILYGLRRYSEDLDFSLVNRKGYDFVSVLEYLKQELKLLNFNVDINYKKGVVDSAFISFSGLLQELGLSSIKSQKISVKLEVDTNPPKGGTEENTLINDEFIFPVKHFDLPSLMAGKLHSVLCRKFVKGRDYYDLIWYLSKTITPNFRKLNNAITQTKNKIEKIDEKNWKEVLLKRLKKINFPHAKKDVERFLMNPEEGKLLSFENFEKLIAQS
jgi:predicted nucleotidyltransferase component of viral defense system